MSSSHSPVTRSPASSSGSSSPLPIKRRRVRSTRLNDLYEPLLPPLKPPTPYSVIRLDLDKDDDDEDEDDELPRLIAPSVRPEPSASTSPDYRSATSGSSESTPVSAFDGQGGEGEGEAEGELHSGHSSGSASSSSSPSSSPFDPLPTQRMVWIGMSTAARNPLAAHRKAEEVAAAASQPKVQRRVVVDEKKRPDAPKPTRSSARVMALQEEKAHRRSRHPRISLISDDSDEVDDDDWDDVDHERALSAPAKRPPVKKAKGKSHTKKLPPPVVPSRHDFLHTLASFSRIGYDNWRAVPAHHIPAMSYEGYVALAYDSLEPATRAAIRDSQPYIAEHNETYHDDPWPLIYGETPTPLALYRRVDRVYGRKEYRVCASRRIAAKEVVAFLAGRLTEQSKAQKESRDDEHQHFFMERSYLRQFFGYEGLHSLMLSTKDHKSIASYIRDPCEKTDGEDANVKVDVTLDTVTGLFFIVLYAAEDVHRGDELYCLPFLGRFLSRTHRQMFLYARISHWHHRYATLLERTLLSHQHIQWDRKVPLSIQSKPLTAEQEAKHYGEEDARSLVYQVSVSEGYLQWDLLNALVIAKCQYSRVAFLGAGVGSEVKAALREVPDFLPDTVTVQGTKLRVDRDALLRLMKDGHDREMIEVREDRCIGSPVRYFDVPTRPSFCVMACRPIPAGTFVFTYGGEISESVLNYSSTYVYNLGASDIRRTVPHYDGIPNLYLDALSYGNIARFVNDNRYRLTEEAAPGTSANLDCHFLMYDGVVHLGFFTTREVDEEEELVSQYGDDYWKTINSRLIDEHHSYYDYVSTYIQHMQNTLTQHRIPFPARPDYCVENNRLFEHKPEPYPASVGGGGGWGGGEDGAEEDGDPRYEVSQVLDHFPSHSTSERGVTHYLVQWTGYDGNTWESFDNLDGCQKLIATYWELRQIERSKKRNGVKGSASHKAKKKRHA